ncbi:hypothetical protein Noc_0743 [Nitrosococcus oceani ATCC 19707]|uniref:Sulfotransferase family protein n=2 Tax=Nitrosococcus oceani TaxID=1229 RepID=Q3JD40_NITOC|nr:sulfotransferase family 2 domain-containing protein [Nitrosococcus oceani]ABA57256.1 hypothetical protein Noc_0743 [Nitrosococcus oceani ATCC 19707]EDZ66349.1 hypothetical protein NOC27_3029 [Nitrosococcus oceani AFC27]KFI20230.1 hypothetical protein IB75_03735 [Nitrosococcus oceani C-27]GEM20128.1 hypothetical protein NONS58_15350 [Nitrosococcus oceani]
MAGKIFDCNEPIRIDAQAIAAWQSLPVAERSRRNRDWIGPRVIQWKQLQEASLPHDPCHYRLFYLHAPKTGGTTLQHLIAKNYRVNDVLQVNAKEALRNPGLLYKKGELPKSVITGHYDMGHLLYRALEGPFFHLTLLRHPVPRVLSLYNYMLGKTDHNHHQKAVTRSFPEFIQSVDIFELSNGQTKRLAGSIGLKIDQPSSLGDEALEIAKDNLAHRFTCFGLQDRYTELLLIMKQLLGWADIFYRCRNVSEKRVKKEDMDQETLACIQERNYYDLALYDFASQLFEERCRQLGITQARVEGFWKANDQYLELLSRSL